jgi:hypothetical protein
MTLNFQPGAVGCSLISVPEAVTRSRIPRANLYVHFKRGEIDAVKRGRRTFVVVESLDQFLVNLPPFTGRRR